MLRRRDEGAITLLVIGYAAIALLLLVVGIDASKVFLAQRALSAAADSAALAAAQAVDRQAVYAGGLRCGSRLPLDARRAGVLAATTVEDDRPGLRHDFAAVDPPQTTVLGATVTVQLSGSVGVPFGRVLSWLDPSRPDGRVRVTEASHAQSPVVGASGC